MLLEYINTSIDFSDAQFKSTIIDTINKTPEISNVIVPFYFLKTAVALSDNKKIYTLIDYPLGFSDLKTRQTATEIAVKTGTQGIDIVLPIHYLANRKYSKIREDIKIQSDLLDKENIRYILEYRIFNHNSLKKMCELLIDNGISNIVTSSGYRLDNINDFIIASQFLKSQFKELKITLSANFWTAKHYKLISQQHFSYARSESVQILTDFIQKSLI